MINLLKTALYYPLLNLLSFIIWLVPGHNAAWGIIFLTLLVRVILIIPSKRAAQAQRRMAQLQPLLKELQDEYGDDRQGLSKAQMELYKKNEINPFGSCVPALIQIPVLLLLYRAIANGLAPHNAHLYSWVPQAASISTNFFGIDLLKPDMFHLFGVGLPGIMPIAAALTQLWYMRSTMAGTAVTPGDQQQQMQRQMMYVMPVITLVFALRLPAGVSLYWVVTTIFSVFQQQQVNKEKYRLSGVDKALKEADATHPEHAHDHTQVVAEVQPASAIRKPLPPKMGISTAPKQPESKESKKGVTVTVRRRGQ